MIAVATLAVLAGSAAIHVDQVGYLPDRPKLAVVVNAKAAGEFVVRRARDGTEALRGTLGPARPDPDSGDTVRHADFSTLSEVGSFVLDVAGVGASHPFEVGPSVYEDALILVARAFYGQRCGTAVDLAPRHPGYRHAACHVAGAPNPDALLHPSTGRVGTVDSTGGWHDAGDYGKYVVNSGLSTAQLLWAYEMYPGRVARVALAIPESGNRTPDLLDEARWNVEWLLKMQDGDGGAWHKVTSERFGSFVMPEQDDGGPRYVIGTRSAPFKGSCATGDLAAVTAIAARVYAPFDPPFAARARAAAEAAWRWLAAHPGVRFRNPPTVSTGEYGDADCSDEQLWAAAELFRTTGEAAYRDYFAANVPRGRTVTGTPPPSWGGVRDMAFLTFALTEGPAVDAALRERVRADVVTAARAVVARTGANAYRVGLRAEDYVWGSNGVAANYGALLAVANHVHPDAAFLDAAADHLHYLLGRNTFGLSWVTQVGDRPFRFPHHRPSGADTNAEPWPGLLSGGPSRSRAEPVTAALQDRPPARRYADDERAYASNEVAINWNAPLVFLLASLIPDPPR